MPQKMNKHKFVIGKKCIHFYSKGYYLLAILRRFFFFHKIFLVKNTLIRHMECCSNSLQKGTKCVKLFKGLFEVCTRRQDFNPFPNDKF